MYIDIKNEHFVNEKILKIGRKERIPALLF